MLSVRSGGVREQEYDSGMQSYGVRASMVVFKPGFNQSASKNAMRWLFGQRGGGGE